MPRRYGRRRLLGTAGGLLAGSVAGCSGILDGSGPALRVTEESAVGTPFAIEFPDGTDADAVLVRATDGFGRAFERTLEPSALDAEQPVSAASFHGDADDSFVETSPRSSPGDVSDGLVGSGPPRMVLQGLQPVDEDTPQNFVGVDHGGDTVDGHDVTVALRRDGETLASATGRRVNVASDVEERRIATDGLVGTVAVPSADGPSPGVVVLHGSAATDLSAWSRRLATHGYVTMTLRYFGAPGLPDTLDDVPLEYFDRAVAWLTGRDSVVADRVGFVGVSRGVEAALLTAANLDRETAVVGYGGSGVVSYGLAERGGSGDGQFAEAAGWEAAWTRDGDPVASAETVQRALRNVAAEDPTALGAAGIPVEDVDGPVVLYGGRDDRVWPSVPYSEYATRRLDHFDARHPYATLAYADAGHAFYAPYANYAGPLSSDALGGTPAANARAAADSWIRTLDFLQAGLVDR